MGGEILLIILIVLIILFVATGKPSGALQDRPEPSTNTRYMKSYFRKDDDGRTRADEMGYIRVLPAKEFEEKPGEAFVDWRGNECKWKE